MSNYPPGVSAGTKDAPWNEEPPKECDECGGVYADGGHETIEVEVDGEIVEEPCPNSGMNRRDYEEAVEASHQEMKMEERRLEQAMNEDAERGI